ncbi:MAG: hypothetical protein H7834_15245, partial [Magnetococcus sp. YQC-9]
MSKPRTNPAQTPNANDAHQALPAWQAQLQPPKDLSYLPFRSWQKWEHPWDCFEAHMRRAKGVTAFL